jgi:hypothetical protein
MLAICILSALVKSFQSPFFKEVLATSLLVLSVIVLAVVSFSILETFAALILPPD